MEETQKLLAEHNAFKEKAKETRERVKLLLQLADTLVQTGHDKDDLGVGGFDVPTELTLVLAHAAQPRGLLLRPLRVTGSATSTSAEPRELTDGGLRVLRDEAADIETVFEVLRGQSVTPGMAGGRL